MLLIQYKQFDFGVFLAFLYSFVVQIAAYSALIFFEIFL